LRGSEAVIGCIDEAPLSLSAMTDENCKSLANI